MTGTSPPGGYQALLLVSFGGPEGPGEVLPFLRRVTAGRDVPEQRLAAVAEQYRHFGGISPINAQNRALLDALRSRLELPVYWGNRNSPPYLADAVRQMADDGVRRALAFVTSAYSSYSGCRQYLEDIAGARGQVGEAAPSIDKLRAFYHHPGFVGPFAEATRRAAQDLPAAVRGQARVVFTAHSLPLAMARNCAYRQQLDQTCRLVAEAAGLAPGWTLAWNSRSGPPGQPWLEPDVGAELARLASAGVPAAVVVPVGFLSDHMEVVYDLDTVAVPQARSLGMAVTRASTPHLALVPMIEALVAERVGAAPSSWLGTRGRPHDSCPAGCCLPPAGTPVSRPAGR